MLKSQWSGETMIFKNDKGFYSTSISKKDLKTGEYINEYLPVAFRKGVDIPNKTKINVINGFTTFDVYTSKIDNKKKVVWKIFITEFNTDSQVQAIQEEDIPDVTPDDDLPF